MSPAVVLCTLPYGEHRVIILLGSTADGKSWPEPFFSFKHVDILLLLGLLASRQLQPIGTVRQMDFGLI